MLLPCQRETRNHCCLWSINHAHATVGEALSLPPANALACFVGWYSRKRLSLCPPLLARAVLRAANENPNDCRGQSYHNLWVGEQQALKSCISPGEQVQADFRLLRIRLTVSGVQLPAANPHPTLPLQARGGMAQALEIGANLPNLVCCCEMIPRGRIRSSPTVTSLQITIYNSYIAVE